VPADALGNGAIDPPERRAPLATYRLQLTPGFGFADAAAVAPYLRRLGVSHVYLSPVLQAAPGSTHGYDVVDHSHASDELGGENGFRSMADAFHAAGLGVVLDVVPNHMAAALPQNRWWWDVLENGPASFWANFFDIDWDPPESTLRNRVLLPILAERYGRTVSAGELVVAYDGGAFSVRYHDNVLPVAPRSLDRLLAEAARSSGSPELDFIASSLGALPLASATDRDSIRRRHRDKGVLLDRVSALYRSDPGLRQAIDGAIDAVNADPALLDALLERQNYRLAFWRTADQQLDYRRFFDIDTLVALRVEDAEVFEETHAHVLDWIRAGAVDGLRIDHIDGLADPERYLRRLDERTDATWVVVEKILEPGERLPASWPVAGTTGYDFANVVTKLFVDPAGQAPLTAALAMLTGDSARPEDVVRAGKELILDTSLAADLNRIVERVLRLTEQTPSLRDVTRSDIHGALRSMIVAFPVYRTYGPGSSAAGDVALIHRVAADAQVLAPGIDPDVVAFLAALLAGDPIGASVPDAARLDVTRHFQQLTGPVMAKGVEDTAFYRYHRLAAENEVGSDLGQWATSPDSWHTECAARVARGDGSLLATSTHDTKRSEDVRARLVLLSEIPDRWVEAVLSWRELTDRYRRGDFPDRAAEYLLVQTFVGAWPLTVERALDYARKATREAKLFTSWTDADPRYDEAVEAWVRGVLGDPAFVDALERFASGLVGPGRVVSLAQSLCKLTSPGTPDIYQGTELWDLSLVDPDNRRSVDYEARAKLLAGVETGVIGADDGLDADADGVAKLVVTARALDVRRRRPDCFDATARYSPLLGSGPAEGHVVAFGRGPADGQVEVVTVVPRLVLGLARRGWGSTSLTLPPGRWHDLIAAEPLDGGEVGVAELLARFPVALLERVG